MIQIQLHLKRIWKQAVSCKSVMPVVIVKDFARSFQRWNAAVPLKTATQHFLRNLGGDNTGNGSGCSAADERASNARKWFHHLTFTSLCCVLHQPRLPLCIIICWGVKHHTDISKRQSFLELSVVSFFVLTLLASGVKSVA
ncbi:CitB domain protein [Candidatus Puniceispirillum marinum IMCC1322]|uniref:CitB domain protein n=2 Tax=Candidatus Puniceispirillum TaxID=767891 RepID=D5BQ65_PUNMI|nr:CitB domain protein [Candidatus Puniceispirillum marinum IMCC1322]